MANDLVRVRQNGFERNAGRLYAEQTEGVEILDEPTHTPDGRSRPTTRVGGRQVKPRTSVAAAAAEKKKPVTASGDNEGNDQ